MSSADSEAFVDPPRPTADYDNHGRLSAATDDCAPYRDGAHGALYMPSGELHDGPDQPKRRKTDKNSPSVVVSATKGHAVPVPAPGEAMSRPPPLSLYPGMPSSSPNFSWKGQLIILTGVNNIDAWLQQCEAVTRATNCYAELTTEFAGFPPPGTVEAFICEARFMTTWRILNASISGPAWAYMRVLGFAPLGAPNPPMPVSAYHFAEMAARRMPIAGTAQQPAAEKAAMILQALHSTAVDYPTEKHFKKGTKWLHDVLDSFIRGGDHDIARALYGEVPAWALPTSTRPLSLELSPDPQHVPPAGPEADSIRGNDGASAYGTPPEGAAIPDAAVAAALARAV